MTCFMLKHVNFKAFFLHCIVLISISQIVSLILSDVIGDPMDIIAGGPTVENTTGPQDALNILDKYSLIKKVS